MKPQQEEEVEGGGPQNSQKNSKTASLPSVEQYNEQKKGRNPYYCVPCKKNFARSSLSSHVKSKHRGKSPKVKCGLCDKVFDKAAKAQDHVSSTHKVYPCPHNGNSNLTGARKGEATGHFFYKTQHCRLWKLCRAANSWMSYWSKEILGAMFCHLAVLIYLYAKQKDLGNSLLLNRNDFVLCFFSKIYTYLSSN